jgi:hypothetical protein
MGRLEGADRYVESVEALWRLSATTHLELGWFWLAVRPGVQLLTIRRTGDVKDGGSFESDYLALTLQADGLGTRLEMFELEDLDRALARFGELTAERPQSSLRKKH